MSDIIDAAPPEKPAPPHGSDSNATEADSRIRSLAIDRILQLEEELKAHGIKARCGMEVEFFVDSEPGKPASIPKDKLQSLVESLKSSRYVEDIREENVHRSITQPIALATMGAALGGIGSAITSELIPLIVGTGVGIIGAILPSTGLIESVRAGRKTKAAQYEINLGDRLAGTEKTVTRTDPDSGAEETVTKNQRHRLGPLKAAIATEHFQQKIREGLAEIGEVNYEAKPRSDNLTSAMHINVSLSDAQGKNLFIGPGGGESKLMSDCLAKLVDVQKSGAVLFLPNDNSYERIHNGRTTPEIIGRQDNKIALWNVLPHASVSSRNAGSVGKISGILHGRAARPDNNRLENRLAGSDADPYLAVVATLGAMVMAVREHEHDKPKKKPKRHPLPHSLDDAVREFKNSTEIKDVLGADLHRAIAEHYDEKSRQTSAQR